MKKKKGFKNDVKKKKKNKVEGPILQWPIAAEASLKFYLKKKKNYTRIQQFEK